MPLTEEELQAKELEIAKREQEIAAKEKELAEKMADPNVDKLAEEKAAEQLKDLKGKLDSAYAKRDETLKKLAEYEQKEKEAHLEKLKAEGKLKEAHDIELAEERAKRQAAEQRTIELTRDLELRNALSAHPFRNDTAQDMAFKQVSVELIQDANGVWIHKTGVSVKDFVKQFVDNPDNEFLLKVKGNSGGGGGGPKGGGDKNDGKSIFDLSQEEVLKRAAAGTLRK